jgi:hypothetical protein
MPVGPSNSRRGRVRVFATLRSPPKAPRRARPSEETICASQFLHGETQQATEPARGRRGSATPSVASSTVTTKPSTAERNIDNVVLGDILFRAWYPSCYAPDIVGKEVVEGKKEQMLERLYVCKHCFKYSKELMSWMAHVRACDRRLNGPLAMIPGRKVYTHGDGVWSVWEVDGEVDTVGFIFPPLSLKSRTWRLTRSQLYCQNLSLFAKLFLDNKSVFFDVTGFLYFLLTHTDLQSGAQQVVGFFSKEKMSWDNNNLACILIFPPWQRKGLGSILISVSYEISRREEIMGGPEKPISDLGKRGYLRFWSSEIARYLLEFEDSENKGKGTVTLEQISKDTWICVEDCLCALRDMGVAISAGKGRGDTQRVSVDKEMIRAWATNGRMRLEPTINPSGFIEGYGCKAVDAETQV